MSGSLGAAGEARKRHRTYYSHVPCYRRQKLLVSKNCSQMSSISTCYRRRKTPFRGFTWEVFSVLYACRLCEFVREENCVPKTHFRPRRPPQSSFNNAASWSDIMLDNVSTPRSRGWGTMAARSGAQFSGFGRHDSCEFTCSTRSLHKYVSYLLRMLTWRNQNCSTSGFCRLYPCND
jgi:hypothetical protein